MSAISQTIFSDIFSWIKKFIFWFEFHWCLFIRVQLTISQHWFRQWLDAEQVTSHYLNQCWPSSLTYICGTRGRWVNGSVLVVRRPICQWHMNNEEFTGFQISWPHSNLVWLTHKQLSPFQNVILFYRVVHWDWNILVWNYYDTMNIWSALRVLMAWCFSTRASVVKMLNTHPCVSFQSFKG